MKTLDLKLLEKNQNNLLGIQFSKNLKIKILKNITKTITKIKIYGKQNCFIIKIINFIQIQFFSKEKIIQHS